MPYFGIAEFLFNPEYGLALEAVWKAVTFQTASLLAFFYEIVLLNVDCGNVLMKKRFIAGAICPSCGEMDSIHVSVNASGVQVKECVECRFSETLNSEPKLEGDLPEARISREEKVQEESTDILRIITTS